MRRVMLTGAAGFIGHHVVEHFLHNTDWPLVLLDRLDTSGNLNRLAQIRGWDSFRPRCKFVYHDLRSPISPLLATQIGTVTDILHLAASTHVDRSITEPAAFIQDNVVGTGNLLDFARGIGARTVYFSTDEVFGPATGNRRFGEWDNYNSRNPYAATKAGGEELALAYWNTYKLPVFIVHVMNAFGERQHPEKFIPLTIRNVIRGDMVMVHASPEGIPGSRFYLHARNIAAALLFLMDRAEPGQKYNIVGDREVDNLELARTIAQHVGKELRHRVIDFHSSRPGHDLRYALDDSRLRNMGFKPPMSFAESLQRTVSWTLKHPEWLGLSPL